MNDPFARVQIAFHSLLFRDFSEFFFGGSEMINETPKRMALSLCDVPLYTKALAMIKSVNNF